MQPVLPDGWFLMEQLRGPSYYWHESGASQFGKPTRQPTDDGPSAFQSNDDPYYAGHWN